MKTKNKKIFLICFVFALCVILAHSVLFMFKSSAVSFAINKTNLQNESFLNSTEKTEEYYMETVGYVIESFNVDVSVGLDNAYNIKETITATFTNDRSTPKHGIFRYIPYVLESETIYNDKLIKTTYYIKINNISSNVKLDKGDINNNRIVKLGDPNVLVNGKTVKYELSYTYTIGYDKNDSFDEIYFNLLGTGNDTMIKNFSYNVSLPSEIDSVPTIYCGTYGSTDTSKISVNLSSDKLRVYGASLTSLQANEAVTIHKILTNGYFSEADSYKYYLDLILCAIAVVVLIATLGYTTYNKNVNKVIKVVNFLPPEDMDPVKMSIYYYNGLNPKAFASLIVYWADKGYVNIEVKNNNNIELSKVKDLPKDFPSYQLVMFNALFVIGENSKTEITDNKITENINKATNNNEKDLIKDFSVLKDIKTSLNSENNDEKINSKKQDVEKISLSEASERMKSKISICVELAKSLKNGRKYDSKSVKTTLWFSIVNIVPIVLFYVIYYLRTNLIGNLFTMLLYLAFGFVPFLLLSFLNNNQVKNLSKFKKIAVHFGMVIALTIPILYTVFNITDLIIDKFCLRYVLLAILFFNMYFIAQNLYLEKQTRKLYGDILGFKKSIEVVDKNRLKMLCDENPKYFYNVLPYAYVLGISDKFIKKFEGLTIMPPETITTSYGLENVLFAHYMIASMNTFTTSIIPNKFITNLLTAQTVAKSFSGSIGSGSSGGGFSGGGFGGGGTRSW